VTKQSDADMIAEFLAKKGATKIPEGQRAYDDKELWLAYRDGRKAPTIEEGDTDRLIRQRHILIVNGKEHVTNGVGEVVYSELLA
jgi:hypothetical protein